MRLCSRVMLLIRASGCFGLPAQSQEPLSDLAWLAGGWQGTMGKAQIEEHWIQPAGGNCPGNSEHHAPVSDSFL
jgi:hypothetical protein